jgi:hypothetical protein
MDRRKISASDLEEMKSYIRARSSSFKEPGILAEILDHFACKTEELMNEDQSLSFQEAMHMAHESFGVRGFAPIASAWEANVSNHYKQWFKKNALKTLASIHGIGIMALSLLMAELYWFFMNKNVFPLDGYEVLIAIQIAGAILFFTNKTGKALRSKHPTLYTIATQSGAFGNYAFLYFFPVVLIHSYTPLLFQTIAVGLVTFTFAFFSLLQTKINKAILSDVAITEAAF